MTTKGWFGLLSNASIISFYQLTFTIPEEGKEGHQAAQGRPGIALAGEGHAGLLVPADDGHVLRERARVTAGSVTVTPPLPGHSLHLVLFQDLSTRLMTQANNSSKVKMKYTKE